MEDGVTASDDGLTSGGDGSRDPAGWGLSEQFVAVLRYLLDGIQRHAQSEPPSGQ
jgi:hypothetical protein